MDVLRNNHFLSQEDYQIALAKIIEPLRNSVLVTDLAGLHLGSSGAVYDQQRADMEALVRPLWGIAPAWKFQEDDELRDAYLDKLTKGTDPQSADYWGAIQDYDQYMVETAALSVTLLLHKDYFWALLSEQAQRNVVNWLTHGLEQKVPKNNWTFFKVLIRVALFYCGEKLDRKRLTEELQLIDSMYVGNGWYVDGKKTQRDYYVAFAFHYYGLIYATFMKEEDPEWSDRFIERATVFAQDFIYYFDGDGEALPYGRSLTYRFAQGAFFSALVFADVEAIPWGEMKMLLATHLRTWMKHDIFTFDGRLSIGYHYENLVMAEGYNAPGSPYWALKTFLLLAVRADHPFWQAEPVKIKKKPKQLIQNGNILLLQENDGAQVLGFPVGMLVEGQAHAEAKYSKFVYSTKFGFSVPKAGVLYEEGAFDNTLAVSCDGRYFRTKREVSNYRLTEDSVFQKWSPFTGVTIETEVYPFGQWHLRVHTIDTEISLEIREGGFSLPLLERKPKGAVGENWVFVTEGNLTSQIVGIEGYEEAMLVRPEVNTSLFFPRTSLPVLRKILPAGKHRVMCLVGGIVMRDEGMEKHDKN
ncbi:hypothetical protein ATZ33_14330 [Enterococcus silesiacus]|uniref:DUF2264 domain-containing protein n=1 Tax=Enterococcus silesiacus TaxID=332949 RepID=A0A0S3KDX6_9ENTE|nr:DUF2264 domain-containing protein [Enterococcus silesiacus]ALS02512.1 hypothetical protein ATZ33_14330 [Enterococcus silesiacus]OJG93576.1 hypothetical protein RV15_GL000178 [Enterococcus silesiacus]